MLLFHVRYIVYEESKILTQWKAIIFASFQNTASLIFTTFSFQWRLKVSLFSFNKIQFLLTLFVMRAAPWDRFHTFRNAFPVAQRTALLPQSVIFLVSAPKFIKHKYWFLLGACVLCPHNHTKPVRLLTNLQKMGIHCPTNKPRPQLLFGQHQTTLVPNFYCSIFTKYWKK